MTYSYQCPVRTVHFHAYKAFQELRGISTNKFACTSMHIPKSKPFISIPLVFLCIRICIIVQRLNSHTFGKNMDRKVASVRKSLLPILWQLPWALLTLRTGEYALRSASVKINRWKALLREREVEYVAFWCKYIASRYLHMAKSELVRFTAVRSIASTTGHTPLCHP